MNLEKWANKVEKFKVMITKAAVEQIPTEIFLEVAEEGGK